jgi:hypothetical protein
MLITNNIAVGCSKVLLIGSNSAKSVLHSVRRKVNFVGSFPYSIVNPLSSLCYLRTQIKIYNKMFFCCFVWVWSLVCLPGEEHTVKMFENRFRRRMIGPKKEEGGGSWRKLYMENFIICTTRQLLL